MLRSLSRTAIFGATLLALAGQAGAISTYSSVAMSCDSIRAAINRQGAALFHWPARRNEHNPFGRFVSYGAGYCDPHQIAETAFIPARDTATCPVLECRNRPFERRDRH